MVQRREFLKQGALALAAPLLPHAAQPRRVLILGAGLAGLSAGYELTQAGHDVTIFEARTRFSFLDGFSDNGAMELREHVATTGTALKRWLIAATYDALAVGALWLVGLLMIGVPLAPLWAFLGLFLQFIPGIGAVLALAGPAITALINGGTEQMIYVLILYAVIVVVDGLVLQPVLMKRTVRVPIWASILTPLVLGILIPFWGVLLAPPLLAVIYAYKTRSRLAPPAPPPGVQ